MSFSWKFMGTLKCLYSKKYESGKIEVSGRLECGITEDAMHFQFNFFFLICFAIFKWISCKPEYRNIKIINSLFWKKVVYIFGEI